MLTELENTILSTTPAPCHCGASRLSLSLCPVSQNDKGVVIYIVRCNTCKYAGPARAGWAKAIEAWNLEIPNMREHKMKRSDKPNITQGMISEALAADKSSKRMPTLIEVLCFIEDAGGVDWDKVLAPTATEQDFAKVVLDAWNLQQKKGRDYGDVAWSSLGARGVFGTLWQRVLRMKNLIWDDMKAPTFDTFEEATLDLINWSVFMAILVRRKIWK
jgi:hypothetical protein